MKANGRRAPGRLPLRCPVSFASFGITVMTERPRDSATRLKSGVARILMKIPRRNGRSRMRRAVASTTRRSEPIAFATAVAGISMPLQQIFPSALTPKPFSRRNRTTRPCDGESANSWMISDHIQAPGKTYENIHVCFLHVISVHKKESGGRRSGNQGRPTPSQKPGGRPGTATDRQQGPNVLTWPARNTP